MSIVDVLSLLVFCVLLSAGQLMFKAVAVSTATASTASAKLLSIASSTTFLMACILYAASTLLWIWILMRLPLSKAYPFVALCMILVPLASRFFFQESLTPQYWLGACLVGAGILVINR